MKTDPEIIPAELFDFIQDKSFEALNAAERKLVLAHFTETEYMHLREITDTAQKQALAKARKQHIKANLLTAFDETQRKPRLRVLIQPGRVWQAAASFLLIGLLAGYFLSVKQQQAIPQLAKGVTDTVYLTQYTTPLPERIRDTVFIAVATKARSGEVSGQPSRRVSNPPNRRLPQQTNLSPVHVVGVDEIESPSNRHKGNSMKDDPLLRNYAYVSL